MRLITSLSIAAVSGVIGIAVLQAARRPHYGGTLRIEMTGTVDVPEPVAMPPELAGDVFETLIRFDEKGEPRPVLAASWMHDPAHRGWIFSLRRNVMLQNGTAWDPPGGTVTVEDSRPLDEIFRDLARPAGAVTIHAPDHTLAGTGPFRIGTTDPGKSLTFEANEQYWGGRPYLDRVEIREGRSTREQALDFELGKADVIELPLAEVRHTQQQGGRIALSQPNQIVALVFNNPSPDLGRVREALGLAIDRTAIRNVLLQRQGEISGALLPQWLSGYAFLFPATRDLARARDLAGVAPPLSFGYDHDAPLQRSIAERVMLNAAEANLTLRPATGSSADLRLISMRIATADPREALNEIAGALHASPGTVASNPSALYEAERALMAAARVIPLFHLPVAYRLSSSVRAWIIEPSGRWRLEDVWLDEQAHP